MYTEIVYLLFFHFRFLKKFWCKTSCLDYLQASPNLMNKFQDSGSLWQLCPMLCIVHRPCCNIGKYVCTIKKIPFKNRIFIFYEKFWNLAHYIFDCVLPAQTTTYMNTWCAIKKRILSKSIYSLLNNVHLYSSSILSTHLESMESTNNNLPINYLLSHLQNQERIQLQSWKCRN